MQKRPTRRGQGLQLDGVPQSAGGFPDLLAVGPVRQPTLMKREKGGPRFAGGATGSVRLLHENTAYVYVDEPRAGRTELPVDRFTGGRHARSFMPCRLRALRLRKYRRARVPATHALIPLAMSEYSPPQEAHWREGAIFTLGHSTLPIQRFFGLAADLRHRSPR